MCALVTGVQTCALPIWRSPPRSALRPDANLFPVRNCAILLARLDHRRGSGFQYDPAAFSRHATPAKGSAFRAHPPAMPYFPYGFFGARKVSITGTAPKPSSFLMPFTRQCSEESRVGKEGII